MNAISPSLLVPPGKSNATHLKMCDRIAELGMQLLELAAQRALQGNTPGPATETGRPARRQPDPNLLFLRLSSMVRQAISLGTKISTTLTVQPSAKATPQTKASEQELLANLCKTLTQELTKTPLPKPERHFTSTALTPNASR